MLSLCDTASFSDAHECREIPIIAANMHRVMQPQKSQIWAVLRKTDSQKRIAYSIANTFLGTMCLSGDICDLDGEQWDLVEKGIAFYNLISHIIINGKTEYFGTDIKSYRYPQGWQGIVRYQEDGAEALAVIHTFLSPLPDEIRIALDDSYEIKAVFGINPDIKVDGRQLSARVSSQFDGTAVYLTKTRS